MCQYSVCSAVSRFWDPMDYSPPGSSVHGIFQARIPEWDTISFSGNLPNPRIEPTSLAFPEIAGGFFTAVPPRETYMCLCTLTLFVDKSQCVGGCFVLLRAWIPGCPSNYMLGSASNRALPETFDCSPWCPLFQILATAHCKFLWQELFFLVTEKTSPSSGAQHPMSSSEVRKWKLERGSDIIDNCPFLPCRRWLLAHLIYLEHLYFSHKWSPLYTTEREKRQ